MQSHPPKLGSKFELLTLLHPRKKMQNRICVRSWLLDIGQMCGLHRDHFDRTDLIGKEFVHLKRRSGVE